MTIVHYSWVNDEEPRVRHYLSVLGHVVVPLTLALVTTIALFYLMQWLIASGKKEEDKYPNLNLVDFVREAQPREVMTRKRKPEKPPIPEELPPPVERVAFKVDVGGESWGVQDVQLETTGDISSVFSFVSDGGYLPIVKVQPVYPRVALQKGMEGWVVVEFTVDQIGRVVDPIVTENCAHVVPVGSKGLECWDEPHPVFDKAAIRAAEKFKYKPKVEDGIAVVTHHVRNKITFELDDNE